MKRPALSHRNWGCRLRDFTWRSHRCIAFENELLRVLVAADRETALELEGGEMIETTIEATAFAGLDEVHSVELGGVVL